MECSDLVTTLKGNALIQSPDAPSQQPTVPDGASQTHTPSQGGTRLELPPHVANSFLYSMYPLRLENACSQVVSRVRRSAAKPRAAASSTTLCFDQRTDRFIRYMTYTTTQSKQSRLALIEQRLTVNSNEFHQRPSYDA